VKSITSRDNPFFKELKKLASSARQRKKAGQVLLDGVHLVQACVEAGNQPQHLLVNASASGDREVAALLKEIPRVPLTQLDDKLFVELSELKTPTGILALIERPQPKISPAHSCFALLLEDIQDPGNVGSMIRSAAAAGCDAVFLSDGCADAWSPKVLRAGMGGHFALSIHEPIDLLAVASAFHGRLYAAALAAESSLYDCRLDGDIAFAIGNEGMGLSDALLRAAHSFTIPMPGRVESLNAAAAAAVCLFEASRQRT
jgi:TrmH family RNA methyltransferase